MNIFQIFKVGHAVLVAYENLKFYVDNNRITEGIKSDLEIIRLANERLQRKIPFHKEYINKAIDLIMKG